MDVHKAIQMQGTAYVKIIEHLSDEAKKYLCFMEDGRLFISKTHEFNPHVTSFRGRLKRMQITYQPMLVDLAVINQMHNTVAAAVNDRGASDMQRVAKQLFERAVRLRASDIHIRCSSVENTSVHFRVHGDLEFQEEQTYEWGEHLCSAIYQSMTDVSDTSFEPLSRQDARISERSKIPEGIDGIRIATTPKTDGFLMVLRLFYNDSVDDYDLSLLGYGKDHARSIELMKRRPIGINIIAGPTGSGKSTTLQRILGSIIKETCGRKNVITVEDPPEYPITGAIQTPVTNVDSEGERSEAFQRAIKAAMRLDPDVIMIGEVRDNPSAALAVRAAMTGHQVWTTIHANSVFGILDRLLDIGVPLEVVADHTIITGLTCQRLVKTLCPHCKVPFEQAMDRYQQNDLRRIMSVVDTSGVHVLGNGCDHCRNSGTSGRTVVAETIITDATLMVHVRKRDRIAAMNYWIAEQMGQTMLKHAIKKIEKGLIDPFAAEDVVGPLNMGVVESDHRISHIEVGDVIG